MLLRILLFGTALLRLCCCNAYKILLVFPISTRSHSILGEAYVKYLSEAGHEITYITPFPMKNPPLGVRQIDVSANIVYMPVELIFDTRPLINQEVDLQNVKDMFDGGLIFANGTLHMEEVQKLLDDPKEEFDAVIVEWLYTEMFSGLSAVFNCPLIWSSSMDPHSFLLSLVDDHLNPAYTTHHLSRSYGLQFWDRVRQLWLLYHARFSKWTIKNSENQVFTNIYEKFVTKRGRPMPSYDDVRYNASLILGNSYITSGDPISLPQSYKAIGGYHIAKKIDPLPQDLQKLMDSAKHGVIYFSLGSLLKSSRIPDHLKKDLLKVFGSLKQTVIWKLEEALEDLPQNVYILPWVPQTSVLAHPNCVLFISHGGLLSKLEALHFGVPIIGIPLYGDQFLNINRAEAKGFGKRVDLHQNGAGKLKEAIREVLENPRYRERMKEYSIIYHDRPVPPEKELVHWVEHVIKTRGALHMRSLALHMPWYQKYFVDLAVIIILVLFVLVKLYKQARIFIRRYLKEKYA